MWDKLLSFITFNFLMMTNFLMRIFCVFAVYFTRKKVFTVSQRSCRIKNLEVWQ